MSTVRLVQSSCTELGVLTRGGCKLVCCNRTPSTRCMCHSAILAVAPMGSACCRCSNTSWCQCRASWLCAAVSGPITAARMCQAWSAHLRGLVLLSCCSGVCGVGYYSPGGMQPAVVVELWHSCNTCQTARECFLVGVDRCRPVMPSGGVLVGRHALCGWPRHPQWHWHSVVTKSCWAGLSSALVLVLLCAGRVVSLQPFTVPADRVGI